MLSLFFFSTTIIVCILYLLYIRFNIIYNKKKWKSIAKKIIRLSYKCEQLKSNWNVYIHKRIRIIIRPKQTDSINSCQPYTVSYYVLVFTIYTYTYGEDIDYTRRIANVIAYFIMIVKKTDYGFGKVLVMAIIIIVNDNIIKYIFHPRTSFFLLVFYLQNSSGNYLPNLAL